MIKWIIIVVVLVLFYYFFIKKILVKPKNVEENKDKEEIMLECKKCGTYVSNKEAIIKDGQYFCSKSCADLK